MSRLSMIALIFAASVAAPSSAELFTFNATLSGLNENPAVVSTGSGNGIVTLDTDANTMRVVVSFTGLNSNTTASHIHCCAPNGTNAGVATVVPTFPGFPLGETSGFYDQMFDLTLASSFNPSFLNNLTNGGNVTSARNTLFNGIISGQAYLNVHTVLRPGGEVRGQLAASVPESSTWVTMLIGFGGIGVAVRRRRKLTARAQLN